MPRPGYRTDKGTKGFQHQDKTLVMNGASWVEPQGAIVCFEDFMIDVLADSPFVSFTHTGTPSVAAATSLTGGGTVSAGMGGWVAGATEAADNSSVELVVGALESAATGTFRPERVGNGVMVFECGFVIPTALTARQNFVGWTDDATDAYAGALMLDSAYVNTATASDAAGWIFSSKATAPTVWKYGSVLATAASAVSAETEGITAVVDAYTVCRVEIDVLGNAYFFQSSSGSTAIGRQAPTMRGANALAVTPTVGLVPMYSAQATTTTAVQWEVDYVFAASAR
jgi:hypothetical protein